MKKINKIISLTVGALLVSSAFAQAPKNNVPVTTTVNPVTTTVNPVTTTTVSALNGAGSVNAESSGNGSAVLSGTSIMAPNSGNVYEREVTPLLRRISQKKALLEEKKLDNEIEKLDSEKLKSQQERTASAGKLIDVSNVANAPILNPMNNANPNPIPSEPIKTVKKRSKKSTGESEDFSNIMPESDVRVLMTYGYEDNLYAKITSGTQGGYVIKKGDILPDGREVANINPNYVEVKTASQSRSRGLQKIYVTGPAPVGQNGQPIVANNSSGSAGSASIIPLMGPMSSAPMLTTSGTIQFPNGPRESKDPNAALPRQ